MLGRLNKRTSEPAVRRRAPEVIVVGGGLGGLSAAVSLASQGIRPLLLERSHQLGGKAHTVSIAGAEGPPVSVAGGPTVLTMINVFEELFQQAGASLYERLELSRAEHLARHFWRGSDPLDLYSDLDRSVEAIRSFAGARASEQFISYHRYSEAIYESVSDIFIFAPKPSPLKVMSTLGLKAVPKLMRADVHRSMWSALKAHFDDPRLQQLFARYATYTGNNPFSTPATLNLISAVEQRGVWRVKGGIQALAEALAELLVELGGEVRLGAEVEELITRGKRVTGVQLRGGCSLSCEAVIFNGDVEAISRGHLGERVRGSVTPHAPGERSLSALTLCAGATATDAPLAHHNVLFSDDYELEFKELDQGHIPLDPTIYICMQARGDEAERPALHDELEPTFALVNAPPLGVWTPKSEERLQEAQLHTLQRLGEVGVTTTPQQARWFTPHDWAKRSPHSGGAIYGRTSRQWNSNLKRMGSQTSHKGLYLAGGSVHPGAGVPMVTISGQLAAGALMSDLGWTSA